MSDSLHFFCHKTDLAESEFIIKDIQGKSIGGALINNKPVFILNYCPHEGAEICKGKIKNFIWSDTVGTTRMSEDRKVIVCPWHAWEFDPESGKAVSAPKGKIKVYDYTLKNDKYYLRV